MGRRRLTPLLYRRCLTSICLPSNKLEGDIELLGKLPNLDDVDLRNNLLTDDGAEEIFIRRQQAVVKLGMCKWCARGVRNAVAREARDEAGGGPSHNTTTLMAGGNPGFNEERLRVFDAQTRFNLQDMGP